MHPPTKALVLAAGLGTRLLPLTRTIPKPLVPFLGVPILEHALQLLESWGVREVTINTHHHAGHLLDFVLRRRGKARLNLSFEPEILGTGGGLERAGWSFGDESFWVFNADVYAQVDPKPLLAHHARHRPLATLWMLAGRGPRTVRLNGTMVTSFADSQPGSEGTFTFSGLHLLTPRVFNYLRPGFSSIIDAYRRAQAAGEIVSGLSVPRSQWFDLGTPEQYLRAHRSCLPGNFSAPGVYIPRGARLENSVIWRGVRIRKSARIRKAIVATGTEVNGPVGRLVMPALPVLRPVEMLALKSLGFNLERTSLCALAPRGSDREFYRLQSLRRRLILIRYGTERPENARFAGHARWLGARGMLVPEILHEDSCECFLLVQDLGDRDLAKAVDGKPPRIIMDRYGRVLEEVAALHRIHRQGLRLEPPFGPKLYKWERELFAEHFLLKHLNLSPCRARSILEELSGLDRYLRPQGKCLLHRDLQSSNILFWKGRPGLIDFQGMRMGPPMYDVASLLSDPYIDLPDGIQSRLIERYLELTDCDLGVEDYWLGCTQRMVQALGAFGRLGATRETKRFLTYIPAGMRQLQRALEALDCFPQLARLLEETGR